MGHRALTRTVISVGLAVVTALGATAAAATVATAATTPPVGVAAHTVPAATVSTASAATVTSPAELLLNGDRLLGTGKDITVIPSGSGYSADLTRETILGHTYMIPLEALPYVGHGLDLSLFDTANLPDTGELSLTITYDSVKAPSIPGVTITKAATGTATGYLTQAGATTFGAALVRQLEEDHQTDSYGADGIFADGVTIALTGAVPVTTVQPDFPMHVLTVRGIDLAGKADTGDDVQVMNATNNAYFGDPHGSTNVFDNGITKYSVPAGKYYALGTFTDYNAAGDPIDWRLVLDPAFTVSSTGSTSVTLDERSATSEATFSTPKASVLQFWSWSMQTTDTVGNMTGSGYLFFGSSMPMFLNRTTRPLAAGTLDQFVEAQLTSPSEAASPYIYNLGFENLSGMFGSQDYKATTASLATVKSNLYSAVAGTGGTASLGDFPSQSGSDAEEFKVPVPGQLTQYFTGSPASSVYWDSNYEPDFSTHEGGQSSADERYPAGRVTTENWNEYPLHNALDASVLGKADPGYTPLSVSRVDNQLYLYLKPFADDTPGHTGGGFSPGRGGTGGLSGTYKITANGKTVASGNADQGFANFYTDAALPARKSTIQLTLTANRATSDLPYPTSTETVWTWKSAQESGVTIPSAWECGNWTQKCDSEPLLSLNYTVAGENLTGDAPAGTQVVKIGVSGQQLSATPKVTSVAAEVSFNDGSTWQPVSILGEGATRYAVFTADAGSRVSLKVSAADTAGSSITETIIRGYSVAAAASTAGYKAACAAPKTGQAACYVIYTPQTAAVRAKAAGFAADVSAPAGWGAKSIEAAYKLPVSKNPDQTIAIVDAYDTPELATYLDTYREEYGLPACTTANGCFRKVNQEGKTAPLAANGTGSGWDLETTLDADMVSAACPHCKILVVEADSTSLTDLAAAEDTAARLGATVISNSYGTRESGLSQAYASAYDHPGHTIVVSAGDYGYTAANFPANLSTVTAVGGTELSTARNARGYSESVWNNNSGAGGSGCSAYVAKPRVAARQGLSRPHRRRRVGDRVGRRHLQRSLRWLGHGRRHQRRRPDHCRRLRPGGQRRNDQARLRVRARKGLLQHHHGQQRLVVQRGRRRLRLRLPLRSHEGLQRPYRVGNPRRRWWLLARIPSAGGSGRR